MKTEGRIELPSTLAQVRPAWRKVKQALAPLGLSEEILSDVHLCLAEALVNAIKYGNRLDPRRTVALSWKAGPDRVEVTVEDQGPGFDHRRLDDPTKAPNLKKAGGRGLFLIRKLMDEVRFNPKGNEIRMVKHFTKGLRHARAN